MLTKSILSGKDHRQFRYYGTHKACNFDLTCRPHGGRTRKRGRRQCPYCLGNRLHQTRRRLSHAEADMRDIYKYGYEDGLQSKE